MSGGNFVAGGGEGVTAGGAVEEIVATGVDVPEEFPEARLLADAQLERSNEILMRRTVSTELSQVLLLPAQALPQLNCPTVPTIGPLVFLMPQTGGLAAGIAASPAHHDST